MLALYIIAGLLILLITILSIPVDVRLRAVYPDRPGLVTSVRWLFGLVKVPVVPRKKRLAAVRKKAEAGPARKSKGPGIRTIVEVLRTRGLFGELKRFIIAVLHRFHVKDFVVDVGAGLEDPAETGMLFAVIGPAIACLRPAFITDIRVVPLPDVAAIRGNVSATVRLWPLSFIPPVLRFVLSVPVILSLKTLIIKAWKKRRYT